MTWDEMMDDLKKEYPDTVAKAEKLAKQLNGFISKDRAIDLLLCRHCTEEPNCKDYCAFSKCILDLPAADVAPVVHGRWISMDDDNTTVSLDEYGCPTYSCRCSECGDWLTASDEYSVRGRYCPNCGARMDLEEGM